MSRLVSPFPLLVIVGPTASGKSALALSLAQTYDAEIVACDALQVRKGLPLLTAKPTESETALVPHHLIGVFGINEPATAARYAELADAAISDIHSRGKRVILCGGTGLYLRALCEGLVATPPADPSLRAKLRSEAEQHGAATLHTRLAVVDPDSAARIAPADYVRIERALEVFLLSGRTMTDWHRENQAERAQGPRYHSQQIGLDPGPALLRTRILARTSQWLTQGLVDEVERCHRESGPLAFPPLGYEQVLRFLRQEIDEQTLIAEIATKTAQYARRQRIWFRSEPGIRWFASADQVTDIGWE